MAYTYKLIQYDKQLNNLGTVVNIVVAVQCNDGLGNQFVQDYSLTPSEVSICLADETKLNPILVTVAANGKKKLDAFVAVKPQPTIVATQTKLDSFVISPVAVILTPV